MVGPEAGRFLALPRLPMATAAFTSKVLAGAESVKPKPAAPLKRPVWPPAPSVLNRRQWESEFDAPIELSS